MSLGVWQLGRRHDRRLSDIRYNGTQHNCKFTTLSPIFVLYQAQSFYCYTQCHYDECYYAECQYAECQYAEYFMPSVIMPRIFMLSGVMLNVVRSSVVMPNVVAQLSMLTVQTSFGLSSSDISTEIGQIGTFIMWAYTQESHP
jgi:hypothetical protein